MKRLPLLFFCFLYVISIAAQTDWREALQQWLSAEDMEETYGEETMELLEEKANAPINLNQTTREELEELPFLSASQVEGLMEYLDSYRPIRSLNELLMIVELDNETRSLLKCFVFVGEEAPQRKWPQWDKLAKYGRHSLTITAKVPLYERRGDSQGYLGYRYRHDFRYQFNYNNRVKFGITGAQDSGEPFFAEQNKMGYDHYSYYFQLRDMGWLQELNLGMYRVQMGMGLIMNTGFHLGKLASLQSMGRANHALTAHSSRATAGYMQGVAATIRFSPHWHATAFSSLRYVDATLNDDGSARTLGTSGYHRTPAEMAKKHNTRETDIGGTIGWQKGTLYLNANAVYTSFSRDLQPQSMQLYQRYAASGNGFFNASLDYGYNNYRWTLAGETALNQQGAMAAIHTVGLQATPQLSLMLLHRYYDKRYTALHGRSFAEGSDVQNEHGCFLGVTWRPSVVWQVQGYVDYAHFSWPRYQVSAPSDSFDALLAMRYQKKRWTLSGRYRLHIRQRNDSNKQRLVNKTEHRCRVGIDCAVSPSLTLRTQSDGVISQFQGVSSRGIMVSQHASWRWRFLKTDAHIGWFCTDDYDSRLYQYEASVGYDFGFPAYYGRGLRSALMVRADMGRHVTAIVKWGTTKYFDRSTIGTGLQQVDRSSLTDLQFHLRLSF